MYKRQDCSSADVWCAVVNDLHDDLILTADAVYRLSRCNVNVARVCTCSDDGDSDSVDNCNNAVNACGTDVVLTSEGDNECDVVHSNSNDNTLDVDEAVNNDVDDDNDDGDVISEHKDDSSGLASCSEVAREQRDDKSLSSCWKLAERGRGGFVVKDDLLYHRAKILGQSFLQLVVPLSRREHVLKMGHDTFGGHMSVKRTKARISYTFYWPSLGKDCRSYIQSCRTCQLKARVTYRDRVPITPIPRTDRVFDHWFVDCAGPFFSGEGQKVKYNLSLIHI